MKKQVKCLINDKNIAYNSKKKKKKSWQLCEVCFKEKLLYAV